MKLKLVAFNTSDGHTVELPTEITSYHQVRPLSFEYGTLWVALLLPERRIEYATDNSR
jgi:hypothetical protein